MSISTHPMVCRVNSTPILLELSAAPHLRVAFICVSDPVTLPYVTKTRAHFVTQCALKIYWEGI